MILEEILHLCIHQFHALKMFCSTWKIIGRTHIGMSLRRGKKYLRLGIGTDLGGPLFWGIKMFRTVNLTIKCWGNLVDFYFQILHSDLFAFMLFQRQTSLLPFKTCRSYSSEAGKQLITDDTEDLWWQWGHYRHPLITRLQNQIQMQLIKAVSSSKTMEALV